MAGSTVNAPVSTCFAKRQLLLAHPLLPGNYSPLPVRHHAGRMIGLPAKAARTASRAVRPCSCPVAITLTAAA